VVASCQALFSSASSTHRGQLAQVPAQRFLSGPALGGVEHPVAGVTRDARRRLDQPLVEHWRMRYL
jgi:hypothetical protein